MKPPLIFAVLVIVAGFFWAGAPGLFPAAGGQESGARLKQDAGTSSSAPAAPIWAVDPVNVGESLPPTGRSLFDFLVMDGPLVNVPFPFEALTRRIESRLGCIENSGASAKSPHLRSARASCLKSVLIPLGRSLQRIAAGPEFFRYPRTVVAVDSEPSGTTASTRHGLLFKDRLYLGYLEKSDLIEVISYNEAAGRFEFQLVKDYRAGATPKVVYANRAVCIACHQNHAPLFSRQVWDETNANPRIAALLVAQRRDFYGIPVSRGVDIPNAIDDATDRANLFAVYNKLWREGCEDTQDRHRSTRCRAALLKALLQYRLSGERGFDRVTSTYREDVLAPFSRTVPDRWPGGLAIPTADIPNRNPLSRGAGDPGAAGGMMLAHVPARFDPLLPREPLEIWPAVATDYAERAIAGLAQFIAEEDVRRLDDHLFALGSRPGKGRRMWTGKCRFTFSQPASVMRRLDIRCPVNDSGQGGMRLSGRLDMPAGKPMTGTVTHLSVPGIEGDNGEFEIRAGRVKSHSGLSVLVIHAMRDGRHVRLTNGNALHSISLRWSSGDLSEHTSRTTVVEVVGDVGVNALEDFSAVSSALAQLLDEKNAVGDLFAAKPFRRAAVLPALFTRLGLRAGEWCCLDDKHMAPARLDAAEPLKRQPAAGAPRFYQYCAICHMTPERAPPNFLYGSADQVAANLEQCAERILVRLSMWQQAPGDRAKTPMPPELALQSLGIARERWQTSDELAELTRFATEMLRNRQGKAPDMEHLLGGGYEALRPCLPAQR